MLVNTAHVGTEKTHLALEKQQFADLRHARGKLRAAHARMQEGGMNRIQDRIQHLQPVAAVIGTVRLQYLAFDLERIVNRKFRYLFDRPEIGKDQSTIFLHRVGPEAGFALDQLLNIFRLSRNLDNAAIDIEQPAVITAANSVFFADAELHRRAPVRTLLVHQAVAPGFITKQDQFLTEHPDEFRHIGDLARQRDRLPVAAQVFTAIAATRSSSLSPRCATP